MQLKPLARSLAVALSLAVIAGCSSTGGTQDGDSSGSQDGRNGSSSSTSGAGSSGQYGSDSSRSDSDGSQQQSDSRIPDVKTIYFDYDRDTIKDEYESVVMAHARYLRSNPDAEVVLHGHTDERGTREYNMALGERRANAVERFLNIQGVSSSQMSVVSYGEERPAERGDSDEAYSQNRRVVFNY
ncbi:MULTISPECIES: peptidoglycan-associated lipoprotein Pal [unclassified Halomonas]|uniref:peptidoglycan-associated lipoprotein Pal n=1 Tax=unclassified Halomonas TaxID=2609666 RepID=UPI0006D995CC|nr:MULTISPECIES: peptidoglycan-associated lipoprotein Pal [unclassified Halomonas]KPQ21553.1 MAG: peptidoglycan-associated lipoprotein Pal [Halomonas sp. HL-93]SBR48855.1 peptidoglycan-associated lipoprotein [Halomonas sp. HL-93]SNY96076.1 peptidoglycan-associated lipoprotein [Halomonas sp. hl-4]